MLKIKNIEYDKKLEIKFVYQKYYWFHWYDGTHLYLFSCFQADCFSERIVFNSPLDVIIRDVFVQIYQILVDMMSFNSITILFSQLLNRSLVNQQRVPASISRSKVVRHRCIANVKTLFWFQILQFAHSHRFFENLSVRLLNSNQIWTDDEVKVVIQFHISKQNVETRIKVRNDTEFERFAFPILWGMLLLQFKIVEEVNRAISMLPARWSLVVIQEIVCHVFDFLIR